MARAPLHFPPILSLNFPLSLALLPHTFSVSLCLSFSSSPSFSSSLFLSVPPPRFLSRSPSRPPPFSSPSSRAGHRSPVWCVGHLREGKPTRAEPCQPEDRLRCNWRAHYLVLSHRDNYLRGRFRAPGPAKIRRRDRHAGSSFYEIFGFFQACQRARARDSRKAYIGSAPRRAAPWRTTGGAPGPTAEYTVLSFSDLYETSLTR